MKSIKLPTFIERSTLEQRKPDALVELVLRQQEVMVQLVDEIERLKSLLSSDSTTSSKPPSNDIHKRSEKAKESSNSEASNVRRQPGGQPGHPGKTRRGFGRIDRYESLRPESCDSCGHGQLSATAERIDSRTIAELALAPIEVVCYQQHHCRCNHCGTLVSAPWPRHIIGKQSLGAKLQSLLVWLGNDGHLSYEKQQEFLAEVGQIEVGLGTLQQTTVRLSQSVSSSVLALGQWVRQQPQAQVDESPWLVKGGKEWMWVVCGKGFNLFHAADTRSRTQLETLLGQSFSGVLVSDDFSVYNGYQVKAPQKCLAHLRRHFKKLIKLKGGNNETLGKVFLALIDDAFKAHRHWRQSQDDQTYRDWADTFKNTVAQALQSWLPKTGYASGLLLRSLRDKAQQWWYFLDHPHVPPDNNRAERALRLAVTKRKVCGGSRSMDGFAHTANLLTVIQTCRAQGRSALNFLHQALMAHADDCQLKTISLIPQIST
ncbi:MAG: IS66 family transposase [Thermosynechococcaceae cyanobacterium]